MSPKRQNSNFMAVRREISSLFKLLSLRSIIASLNHIDNKSMISITKYMVLIEKPIQKS